MAEPRLLYNGYGPSVSVLVTVQLPLPELLSDPVLLLSELITSDFLQASIIIDKQAFCTGNL